MPKRTLQLTTPFGKLFLFAMLILSLLIGLAEVLLRQSQIQALLSAPSLNSRHRQFEVQWHRLETLKNAGVEIQCIALGNSMMWRAFDPQAYSVGFQSRTNEQMDCFNFGVDGITPVAATSLARILIETYHPKLLIYGISARDYAVTVEAEGAAAVLETAWIQYRLGNRNIEGWLVEHSYLYRYRRLIVDLMHANLQKVRRNENESIANQYGFDADPAIGTFVELPPNPDQDDYHVQSYFGLLRNYNILLDSEVALDQLLDQMNNKTMIIVVEMPVPPTYFYFFDNPQSDYKLFLDTLKSNTAENQVHLIKTTQFILIPYDGWVDYTHVNTKGASLFSEWLGVQIGHFLASD